MKLSVSNLAWSKVPVSQIATRLRAAGIEGIEIAPTLVWEHAPHVDSKVVSEFAQEWREYGLEISGIQSLLYGHPEFQVFDRKCWPKMISHLKAMIRLAGVLDSGIAVMGSPKNRIRGSMHLDLAFEMSAEFLAQLIPTLEENRVVFSLEPNAPEYGADFITRYSEAVMLTEMVDSPWVQPQIDTGCLFMVNENPGSAALKRMPVHVHVSAPFLSQPVDSPEHDEFAKILKTQEYGGWIVLEMLGKGNGEVDIAIESADWLKSTYGVDSL